VNVAFHLCVQIAEVKGSFPEAGFKSAFDWMVFSTLHSNTGIGLHPPENVRDGMAVGINSKGKALC